MKKSLIFLFAVMLFVLISACGNSNEEPNNDDSEAVESPENSANNGDSETSNNNDKDNNKNNEDGLNDVVEYFKNEGYKIGEKEMKATDMVGANNGFGIDIDGEQVEFYIYDDDSEDLQEIKDDGAYNMDGFSIPAINNGNFVLMGYDDHSNQEEIVDTFKSY